MVSILDLDPRWRTLMAKGGVMDIGFDHPSDWPHGERGEEPFVKEGDDQLTSELCRFGAARFLRVTLSLPIRGSEEVLYVALWAKVAHDVFYAYLDTLDGAPAPAPAAGTLANNLTPLAGSGAELMIEFGDGTARPAATLTGVDDLSFDQLLDLYEAAGALSRDELNGA
ncbi:DUF2199 domain-containing protein [Celeribacter arenosi]|uniref:DUF2199 domain-containing protein n=1 Tax=Celeribacter arenosi TaxID=792649 RepID=A0ABP7KCX4_9RHOB